MSLSPAEATCYEPLWRLIGPAGLIDGANDSPPLLMEGAPDRRKSLGAAGGKLREPSKHYARGKAGTRLRPHRQTEGME